MNPLVKDMLETAHSHDIELKLLEEWFEHEVQCEASHGTAIPDCSITATHRVVTSCSGAWNVCQSAALAYPRLLEKEENKRCRLCSKSVISCWTITPI